MKPGWKTTEFWGMVLVAIGGAIATIADNSGWGWLGIVAAAVTSLGYTWSRTALKIQTEFDNK